MTPAPFAPGNPIALRLDGGAVEHRESWETMQEYGMRWKAFTLALASSLSITACGGGGSSGAASEEDFTFQTSSEPRSG